MISASYTPNSILLLSILGIIIIAGVIFWLTPNYRLMKPKQSSLPTAIAKLDKVKGFILLISQSSTLEGNMAYQIIRDLTNQKIDLKNRYYWLVHGGTDITAGTSFFNATAIKNTFKSKEKTDLFLVEVQDINNPSNTFEVIKKIYIQEILTFGLRPEEIVCDCTGATKSMTIGAALACIEDINRRLVILPQGDPNSTVDSGKYIEVDTRNLYKIISIDDET